MELRYMRRLIKRLVLLASFCSSVALADACLQQLPDALRDQLEAEHPKYRSPFVIDATDDYVQWNLDEGGNGCWKVANGEFDDRPGQDFVVLMTESAGEGSLLVVAFNRTDGWELHALDRRESGREALYVRTALPGTHFRLEAVSGTAEPAGEDTLRCERDGIEFGKLEAAARLYCFTEGGWRNTWLSD